MDKVQAEESIKLIRDVMERSARYTSFTGLSGILAGLTALAGCAATYWIYYHLPADVHHNAYAVTWVSVLIFAIAQDMALAQRKARRNGTTIWVPATYQILKAAFPGVFAAFVISIRACQLGELDAIPAIWALGYGTALCAAGMFTIREVRIFGVVELIIGTVGLFLFSTPAYSLYVMGLSFGVCHIVYGSSLIRKYGW